MIPAALRPSLGVLALAGGLAVLGITLHLHTQAAARMEQARAEWQNARARLAVLPQRLAEIETMRAHLPELRQRGFFGPERRLDLVSALARAQDGMGLKRLGWRLEAGRPVQTPGLTASPMAVELAPMDPQRLATWLDRLDGLGAGTFSVDRCDWSPGEEARMQCQLTWWTWNGARP